MKESRKNDEKVNRKGYKRRQEGEGKKRKEKECKEKEQRVYDNQGLVVTQFEAVREDD